MQAILNVNVRIDACFLFTDVGNIIIIIIILVS